MSFVEVELALKELVRAYESNSYNEYFSCFSESASVVLYASAQVFDSKSSFEREWQSMREQGFEVLECRSSNVNISLCGETAIVIHDIDTKYQFGDEVVAGADRETVVFQRDSKTGKWLVCHEHISPRSA